MKNYVRSWIIAVLCLLGSCVTLYGMEYFEYADPLFVLSMAIAQDHEQADMETDKHRACEVLKSFKALAAEQRRIVGALEDWSYSYAFIVAGPIENFEYISPPRDDQFYNQLLDVFTRIGAWKTWEAVIDEKFQNVDFEVRSALVESLKQLFEKIVGDFATNAATRSIIKKKIASDNLEEDDVFSDGFAFIHVIDEFVAAAGKALAPSMCIIL